MVNADALRQALASFLGDAQYRKFVQQGMRGGRLRFWQEKAWSQFTASRPEFAVGPDELATVLRVCHLHGDELLPDSVDVFHGCRDQATWYIEARNQLFPHAAQDVVSSEGQPFEGDRVQVLFCPSCRAARRDWKSRRDTRERA